MVMSLSSAAFFAENFAGTVSVFAGAPGTAKAPLTNAAFAGGLAFGGGCCWAAARPTLPTNASASALVRTGGCLLFLRPRLRYPPLTPQQTIFLFDHLVGAAEQRRRDGQPCQGWFAGASAKLPAIRACLRGAGLLKIGR